MQGIELLISLFHIEWNNPPGILVITFTYELSRLKSSELPQYRIVKVNKGGNLCREGQTLMKSAERSQLGGSLKGGGQDIKSESSEMENRYVWTLGNDFIGAEPANLRGW